MKKIILLFAIILSSSVLFAQSPLNLGVKLGANYSIIKSDVKGSSLSDQSKMSFTGGALARLKIKKLSLQAELLFATKGGELKAGNITEKVNFSTLDVPLLVGYKIFDLKVLKIRANAGVVPSFTLSKDKNTFLYKEGYKDSYISAAAGFSVDIPLFIFDVRYQHGLGEFYDVKKGIDSQTFPAGVTVEGDGTISNNLLTISVAYKFL